MGQVHDFLKKAHISVPNFYTMRNRHLMDDIYLCVCSLLFSFFVFFCIGPGTAMRGMCFCNILKDEGGV